MKLQNKIIVFIIAALVVGIGIYMWPESVRETVQPIPQAVSDTDGLVEDAVEINETESVAQVEWVTYNNDEFGYRIDYPGDWLTREDDEGRVHFHYPGWREMPEGGGSVSILVEAITIEEFISDYNSADMLEGGLALSTIISQEDYMLDGVDGYKLVGTTAIGLNESIIFVPGYNGAYVIVFHDYDDVHLEILETFRFK